MKWKKVWAVAMKDLAEVRGNRAAWLPMLIVPLVFVVILPLALVLIPPSLDTASFSITSDPDLQAFLDNLPPEMSRSLMGLDEMQTVLMVMLGYFFAPMLLMLPLMFSTTIAAESFAGERERKTMEALLYTAASDMELFLGKVMAGVLPAMVMSRLNRNVLILAK